MHSALLDVALRECRRMITNGIYLMAMVVFPLMVVMLLTGLMEQGQPTELPVGVVDLDHTSVTRQTARMLDSFQGTKVTDRDMHWRTYQSESEARRAVQQGEIFGFVLFPSGMTADMVAGRKPTVSFYYSNTSLTAGSLLFRDMKTAITLMLAGAGQTKLQAKGLSDQQIKTMLQPITLEHHAIGNPWINYNYYLSIMMVPGSLLLFVFLLTPYSIGSEMKEGTASEWLKVAGGNPTVAVFGKLTPIFLVYSLLMVGFFVYAYHWLGFPHAGSVWVMMALCLLSVMASTGFGAAVMLNVPSLRMAMSVCSLWGVLSFSMVGTAFPVFAMDGALQALANLFPLRHYFVIYSSCVFNHFPLSYVWTSVVALVVFAFLPLLFIYKVKPLVEEYKYNS